MSASAELLVNYTYCYLTGCRNDASSSKKPPVSPKPVTAAVDTDDGPPKMSHVIGQLRQVPPRPAPTPNDGDYSSIDLVRTAGARARSASDCDGRQNVYGPLLMQQQRSQDGESPYDEIGMQ